MKRTLCLLAIAAAALCAAGVRSAAAQVVSTFDDLALTPNSFYFPAATTTFASGAGTFNHSYSNFGPGCCWEGWSYSNTTDTTTAGFTNQYSAFAGGGALGSANYGVAFSGFVAPVVAFATPATLAEAYFTNTTYAALSMRDGDGFAKRFGGPTGNDPDYLKLTIIGKTDAGGTTGSVELFLADYRFANNAQDYILGNWTRVDLSSLGTVSRLEFTFESTDNGSFGINTPAYFALDNLAVTPVPEPAAAVLLLAGLAVTIGVAQRRRRKP